MENTLHGSVDSSPESIDDKKATLVKEIRFRFESISSHLDERSIRLFAAVEAQSLGFGGIEIVSEATGLSDRTIRTGIKELTDNEDLNGRTRRKGGGRKKLINDQEGLLEALLQLVEPNTFGEAEKSLKWVSKSLRHLAEELNNLGYNISHNSVAQLLEHELEYTLQSNNKTLEKADHVDRDAQFRFINRRITHFQEHGLPVISIDCKKKENVGNYKNNGQVYLPKKSPIKVKGHDFPDKKLGKAIPYGIYDITANQGYVNLGIDHETPKFSAESIRRWYNKIGSAAYPQARKILITADNGSGNSSRGWLWKSELSKLAQELGIDFHVCHLPPGTSKWNKVEHRMFSEITKNWKGHPLLDLDTITNYISNTTTKSGLKIICELDTNKYPTGEEVGDDEIQSIGIREFKFRGNWNYVIKSHGKNI